MAGFDPTFDAAGTGTRGGSVPAPGSVDGTRYFLRADQTWAVPPSGGTPTPPPGPSPIQYSCDIAGYITYSVLQQAMQRVVDTIIASNLVTDAIDLLLAVIPGVDLFGPELTAVLGTFFTTLSGLVLVDLEAALANTGFWQDIVCAVYNAMSGNPLLTDVVLAAAAAAITALPGSTSAIRTAIATLTTDIGAAAMIPMTAGANFVTYDCSLCSVSGGASGAAQTQSLTPNLTVTDGTNTVKGVKTLQVNHATVGGTAPSATLTPALGFAHNDVSSGVEPQLDFEDGGGVAWTLTDDPTHTRMKLSATTTPGNVVGIGVVASRPAFGNPGNLYYGTDTHLLYGDTGSAWITLTWDGSEIASGSVGTTYGGLGGSTTGITKGSILAYTGSAWAADAPTTDGEVLVATSSDPSGVSWATLSGAPGRQILDSHSTGVTADASVTLSPASTAFNHLELIWIARSDVARTDSYITLQINGDTGGNYNWAYGGGGPLGNVWGGGYLVTSAQIAIIAGNSSPSGKAGVGRLIIPWYHLVQWHKAWTAHVNWNGGDSGGLGQARVYGGSWENTAAITSLKLISDGVTGFQQGSQFVLYGIS